MNTALLKNKRLPGNVAALSFLLGTAAGSEVQLLPAGEFKAIDGRPMPWGAWKLTDANAQTVVALANSRVNDFVIDYEHQTQLADTNGLPAPAAGWFSKVEYRPGKGLFATDVRWTARAKGYIGAEEYKFVSAVFNFDPKTGAVEKLLCAALTNNPGLDGMDAVQLAALTARFSTTNPEHSSMNPVLIALLKALGLPATEATTEVQALSAVAALKSATPALPAAVVKALDLTDAATEAEALTAVATLKTSAETATAQVALFKTGGNPDPSKWVSLDKFTELSSQVATLSANGVERQVDELINAAKAEGKCSPVVESVWRDIGKVNVAQLKALIDKTPGNPALAGLSQTASKKLDKVDPNAELSTEQLAMCKHMGLTVEEFRKGLATA